MDGSKMIQAWAGRGKKNDHDADDKKTKGASQTSHIKDAKVIETERHKTFHGHAASHRRPAA